MRSAYTFMTLENAKALRAVLRRDRRVLVLGAGLIGLKCVEGIAGKVAAIDVVDMADRILPSILDCLLYTSYPAAGEPAGGKGICGGVRHPDQYADRRRVRILQR